LLDGVRCAAVPSLLEARDLTVAPRSGAAIRVPGLDLMPGAVAALHGPSGCGKTTMLHAMLGLFDERLGELSGSVRWRGEDLLRWPAAERMWLLRRDVTFLLQDAQSALDPLQSVGRQIAQATKASKADIVEMLGELGVADAAGVARRLPHEISGGEAQRALISIAFLRSPALVVADEPSASLDDAAYEELCDQMRAVVARGSALLLATHDERLLTDLSASVWTFRGGDFVRGQPASPSWPAERRQRDAGAVPVLALRRVSKSLGGRPVLRDVELEVHRGEIVAIVGASGAGKTTLARLLAGQARPDAGRIEAPQRRGAVQLLCQNAYASLSPGRSLRSLLSVSSPAKDVVASLARELQLPDAVLDRTAAEMSGGERRRAALLRALCVRPDVLVLDEPTASLDRATSVAVVEMLLRLRRQHRVSLVFMTHDRGLATAIAHRVVSVEGGRITPFERTEGER
jgi:peptide/nickel transport system ATP-binding protein